jgi:hypothetical protein
MDNNQKIIKNIGFIVLSGILIKLSYVFVYLFKQLDGGSVVSMVTGVTFALASVYFVLMQQRTWLKILIVALDVATILYYYLHDMLNLNISFASVIIAAYSGLIVYYVSASLSMSYVVNRKPHTDIADVEHLESDIAIVEEKPATKRKYMTKAQKEAAINLLQTSMF